ncbi:hypothetical protein EYF80_023475 [Liparis tanakae]|uniref:Uncharacterized protein n=1 Tax=Liparis tanakae TaxID=230148 RepID=A0A4Z2HKD5_9TELE|nr:hypothetical protein EYF80_023475 [Liparis tanakae]
MQAALIVEQRPSPEKLTSASLLLLVSAMARRNCSRMWLSSEERCSVRCSATRRRSFKAWNSRWYTISFSEKNKHKARCIITQTRQKVQEF